MAQAEIGALRVTLSMNVGEFIRNSQRVDSEISKLGSSMSRLHDNISRSSILFTAGAMAAQRFAQATMTMVNTFTSFQKGMSDVSTLVDTSVESMGAMSKAVLDLSGRVPVALSDLTGGLYDLRSAGVSSADAMNFLERSAKLAVAGLGTTKEAVGLATSAINAFGLSGEEANKVFDTIFKTVKFGKTTISGLAEGFGGVAGTVAQAGVKIDEYLASVAALTTTGLPAAQAHTQIRAAIAGLTRESELGKQVLDKLGATTFKQLIEQSGGMVNAFIRVRNVLRDNSADLIKLTGSVEAYNAVVGLAGKQYGAFKNSLDDMRGGLNAVDEAFKKQEETLHGTIQKMMNNFNRLAVEIGTALEPIIKKIANGVEGLIKWFNSLSPEMQEMVAIIGVLATAVGPAVIALGFFANGLATLIPVVTGVIAVIGSLWSLIAGLIAVSGPVGAFVVIATTLVTAWNIFKEEIIAIWTTVYDFIAEKVDNLIGKFKALASVQRSGFLTEEEWAKLTEGTNVATTAVSNHTKSIQGMQTAWQTAIETIPPQFNDGYVVPMTKGLSDMERLLRDEHNAALRDAKRIIEEIQTPMEALEAKQWKINRAFAAGALTVQQYGKAMDQASAMSGKNIDALASTVSSNLSTIFGETKGVAIATALINTYQGITRALATYPPPIAQAMAAIQAAAGFAQVANIRKQTSSGGGGGGGSSGGGEAVPATPGVGVAQSLTVEGINPNDLFTGTTVKSLASALLDFQRDGGKVILT